MHPRSEASTPESKLQRSVDAVQKGTHRENSIRVKEPIIVRFVQIVAKQLHKKT